LLFGEAKHGVTLDYGSGWRRNNNLIVEGDRRGLFASNGHTRRSAALLEMAAGHRGSGRKLDEREIRRVD
jgi:hypothetical protein